MTDRELMEKAGDFLLSFSVGEHLDASKVNDLIYALRERLVQPTTQGEERMTCPDCERNKYRAALWRAEAYKQAGHDVIERKWVGLTKEEAKEISLANRPYVIDMIAALEARLKEKNT
jgi:hypothetical protein